MRHWRVTRPDCYTMPGCPGMHDKSARQGHYCNAENEDDARRIIRERLELDSSEPLDVQAWS